MNTGIVTKKDAMQEASVVEKTKFGSDQSAEEKLMARVCEKHGSKMLYVLWLIKKYNIPYEGDIVPKEEKNGSIKGTSVIDNTAFMMKVIYNTDPHNKIKDDDESIYADFIRIAEKYEIYDQDKDVITNQFDQFLDKLVEKNKKEAAQLVVQYLCDCLMFDRGIPNKGKYYWEAAEAFIKDVDETAQYNLKQTSAFWSLLCNLAASYEDIDMDFKEGKNIDKTIKYINRAFEVREQVYGKKDWDKYFESESYAIDLNNIGYTLLKLDGSENSPTEFGSYEKLIRKIYDEVAPFLRTASNLRWKALVISNLGAIAGQYGSHIEAVRYDLQALALKESLMRDEQEKNIQVKRDLSLTTLKSHLNIVRNALRALFELQMVYGMKSHALIPQDRLNEYISLMGIHAVEALRLRNQIDDEIKIIVSNETERKKPEVFLGRQYCGLKLKEAIKCAVVWLEELRRDIGKIKKIDGFKEYELHKYKTFIKSQKEYMKGIDNYLTGTFEEYKDADVKKIEKKDIVMKITRYKE